ncbi:MAG: helix-turn-helix domain-containing protein [Sulfolobaceae archaeon]|jgi:uncharacterized membrane protein
MRYTITTFLLLTLLITVTLISHAASNRENGFINIYYNGTVEAELNNVSKFVIIGSNVTDLKVVGAYYNLSGNILYLKGYNTTVFVSYKAILPKGVIRVSENNNFTINVFLPINSSINYIYPQPDAFVAKNGLYIISFYNVSELVILYTFSSIVTVQQSSSNDIVFIIIGLIASDAVLLYLILFVVRKRGVEEKEEETNVSLIKETLDERDTIVLEAIKMGTKTLADIVRQTGLPKSTAYRRVKKLVKLGYVEEIREEGKIRYEIKKNQD